MSAAKGCPRNDNIPREVKTGKSSLEDRDLARGERDLRYNNEIYVDIGQYKHIRWQGRSRQGYHPARRRSQQRDRTR